MARSRRRRRNGRRSWPRRIERRPRRTLPTRWVSRNGLQRKAAGVGKIVICHATGSAGNPYVEIEVDRNGLNGHGDHPADLIPAPAEGCPRKSSQVQLDEAKQASAPEQARPPPARRRRQPRWRRGREPRRRRRAEEESLGKSDMSSARQESSSAAATAAKATQEHQTAASETDPTKAAQLEAAALGDDQLAASQQLLSEIDKSLAGLEQTLAIQDAALARKEHSAAETGACGCRRRAGAGAGGGRGFGQGPDLPRHRLGRRPVRRDRGSPSRLGWSRRRRVRHHPRPGWRLPSGRRRESRCTRRGRRREDTRATAGWPVARRHVGERVVGCPW